VSNLAEIGFPYMCSIRIKTIWFITKTRCTYWLSELKHVSPLLDPRILPLTHITYLNLTCKIHSPVTYHEASTNTTKSLIVLQRTYHGKTTNYLTLWWRSQKQEKRNPLWDHLSKTSLGRGSPYIYFFSNIAEQKISSFIFSIYTLFEPQNVT